MISMLGRAASVKGVAILGAIVLALLASNAFFMWRWNETTESLGIVKQQKAELSAELKESEQEIKKVKEERARLLRALKSREERLAETTRKLDALIGDASEARANDPEVREWASDRLPGVISDGLRTLTPGRTDNGNTDGKTTSSGNSNSN